MADWWKGILKDIREKTAGMDREQKLTYIGTYYWYHILFVAVGLFLVILLIRHLFFGEPPKEFTLVMVNQAIDFERDEKLLQDFGEAAGIDRERITVDSNYVFSYVGKQIEGANESSFDKFFFRLGGGELDGAIIPESFYRYCMELEYEFADLGAMLTSEQKSSYQHQLLEQGGVYNGIYAEDTPLMDYLDQEADDPVILVFFEKEEHREADRAFLEFALGNAEVVWKM